MKKIFRMALVFALAGAALMYTGCTKDYSEDINKLDKELTSLEGKYQDLLTQLNDAKSSLEAAYKAADKVLEGNFDTKIAEIKAAIAKKADQAAVDASIDQLKKDLMAEAEKLEKANEALKKEVKDLLDDFYATMSGEIRSLVFVPEFYLDGIEASAYDFTKVWPFESYWSHKNAQGKKIAYENVTDKGIKIVFPVDSKIEWRYILERDAQDNPVLYNEDGEKDPQGRFVNYYKDYTLGQNGKLTFDLNPSSFNVEDAEWSLKGMDRAYITRAEGATEWTPEFIGVSKVDGQAVVEYSIANPEALFSSTRDEYMNIKDFEKILKLSKDIENDWYGYPVKEYNNIPVIQAQASLKDGKSVSSAWNAIANGEETLKHLAFASDNDYEARGTDCTISGIKDLYVNPVETIAAGDVVPVQYNGGAVDLSKLISIHEYINLVGDEEITIAELNAKYPGYKYEFELLPFTLGENNTSEDMYGSLTKEGMFTPCYVKTEGGKTEKVVIAKGSEDKLGISAVGRTPVVLVTLVEPKGDVVLYGYFKIQIAKNVDKREVNIPSFGKLPLVCSPITKKSTWSEFSYLVLEKLGLDYSQFAAQYTDTEIWANEMVEIRPNVKEEQFIKIADVTASGDVYSATTTYGTTTYAIDKTGSGVNNAFTWAVDTRAIGAGKTKTIYHKFINNIDANDVVFVTLTAEVAEAAKFDFGKNKIANEWFDDLHVWAIDDAEKNTAHMNTLVAEADNTEVNPVYADAKGGNVLKYLRNLNHYYQNYTPGKTLSEDADPIYKDVLKDNTLKALLNASAEYSFASEQPAIKGVQLFTNEYEVIDDYPECKVLYAGKYANGALKTHDVTVDNKTVKVADVDEGNIIAVIVGDEIQYKPTATAKKFLNYWSHKETAEDQILYANIHVDVTYGTCNIEAGDAEFHLRFIRPLDITLEGQKISKDGVVDGANVYIAQFLSGIVDWNGVNVIKVTTDEKTGKKTFSSNVVSNIDMFKFYQFKNIKVDISKTKVNGWKEGALDEFAFAYDQPGPNGATGIKPGMKLSVGWIDGTEFKASSLYDETTKVFNYDLTAADHSVAAFNTYVINYRNESARVDAFDMQIPISFEYAWGSYDGTLEIHVDATN